MARGKPLFYFDKRLAAAYRKNPERFCLVGIDEAGRGPWAGPVVASAVILPPEFFDERLNDSKKISARARERLYQKITQSALWAVGVAEASVIDAQNILQATYAAMKSSLETLLARYAEIVPDLVAVDGRPAPGMGFPQLSVVRGDSKSAAIAAASVIAKVTRDGMMADFDRQYPHYGFARHKGYGTRLHREKLNQFGPSPIHRRSFSPVKDWNSSHAAG